MRGPKHRLAERLAAAINHGRSAPVQLAADGAAGPGERRVVLAPNGLRLMFRACLRGEPEAARIRDLGLALARLTWR